jgi:PAS domain-containing protein
MSYIDSKENEEELAYARALMRSTLEATADGILATDEQGRIASLNAKFGEMWRMPRELIDQRDIQKIRTFIAQQLKNPERYLARIAEIEASREKSFDSLEFG